MHPCQRDKASGAAWGDRAPPAEGSYYGVRLAPALREAFG
jgi:hypothetical protein